MLILRNGLCISHYFKSILDDRSVIRGKPHPEIYQKCAQSIGLLNEQCIVFEDALSGIKAAKAAGSKVVALATTHEKSALNAHLIVNDFSEINIQTLFDIL